MNTPLLMILISLVLLVVSYWLTPGIWARILIALRRSRGRLKSRFLNAGGRTWHYLEGGQADETLVLIHGFGADADHWVEVSRSLGRHFHLVAPDMPGFGRTELGENYDFTIASQVDRLLEFLDAKTIEKCHLAGNSMGGLMAAELAVRCPERIKTLWLLAPFGMQSADESETQAAIRTGETSPFNISSLGEFRRWVLKRMFGHPKWIPYPLVHHTAQQAFSRLAMGARAHAHIEATSPPLETIAAGITQPTLVQWGSEDRVTDASAAEPLANLITNSHLVIQLGTGHLPMLELPADSVDIYLHFLKHETGQTVSQPGFILKS